MFRSILAFLVVVASLAGQEPAPKAERRPFVHREHGEPRPDDYSWMKHRDDPAVRKYLAAENAYTSSYFKPLKPLYSTLLKELRARVVDEDVSVPVKRGGYLYYDKYVAGSEYETLCRKTVADGGEEIMLDFNQRAKGHPVFVGGEASVSPDDRLLAWKENHDGTDVYSMYFREIATGKLLPDVIPGTAFSMGPVWANDNRTVFYTTPDEVQRSWRVVRHVLGTAAGEDVVVYEETDRMFDVRILPSKDRKFLLIECNSTNTTETRVLSLDRPAEGATVLIPRQSGIRHNLAHREGKWYSVSNLKGTNGSLLVASDTEGGVAKWEELWPYDERQALQWGEAYATHLVVGARNEGVPGVFLVDVATMEKRWVTAPVEGASFDTHDTPEYHTPVQRVAYTSYLTPYTVADLDLKTGTVKVLKQKKVPSGFDASKYVVEKVEATAVDGVKLPVWLVRRKDLPLGGTAGLVLDGYGSYGSCSDPWFDASGLSLLDRGVTLATAQVRGGGEFGRTWYESGRVLKKEVTFTDYIACARRLVELKHTSPSGMVGYGASAGGLIMGYILNQAPELFRAVVADVPFVDALNTQFDPTIPLVTGEYEEWGNPEDRAVFDVMRRYVPYENVIARAFPSLYVTTGWNDPRVACWEPAKWVARIRAVHQGKNPVLLETNFDAGHGGATGRYAQLEDVARRYAFILRELGEK